MVLRQSGEAESGDLAHIYAVDTRHVVQLQFYPEGYEWAETEPILISKGFAGSRVCFNLQIAMFLLIRPSSSSLEM